MSNLEKDILQAAQAAVGRAISEALGGYQSPLTKLTHEVVNSHIGELRDIFESSFSQVIKTDEFKNSVHDAFRHKVAKLLVSKLEGSVEKAVTTLRSDPVIRAKMTLAIESVIKSGAPHD